MNYPSSFIGCSLGSVPWNQNELQRNETRLTKTTHKNSMCTACLFFFFFVIFFFVRREIRNKKKENWNRTITKAGGSRHQTLTECSHNIVSKCHSTMEDIFRGTSRTQSGDKETTKIHEKKWTTSENVWRIYYRPNEPVSHKTSRRSARKLCVKVFHVVRIFLDRVSFFHGPFLKKFFFILLFADISRLVEFLFYLS